MGTETNVLGVAFIMAYLFIFSIIGLAVYIMEAVAVHKMGKVCGVPYPWLAWIPYASSYALGYIADKDAEANGRPATHYRKTLLIMNIIINVVSFIIIGVAVYVGLTLAGPDGEVVADLDSAQVGSVMLLLLLSLADLGLSITCLVFQFIALWHVYKLFDPNNAAAFTILSVLITGAIPILLLVVSRKTPVIVPPVDDATFSGSNGMNSSSTGGENSFYIQ